jgi:hypothetical protein
MARESIDAILLGGCEPPSRKAAKRTELKGLPALGPAHLSQVISYLKAMNLTLGLLVNFGEQHLKTNNAGSC